MVHESVSTPSPVSSAIPAVERILARAPRPVPAPVWLMPDPQTADEDGVVGVGADLTPATLVDAYRRGIFPWPHRGMPLPWFSPDPRGVIDVDGVHVSRSLARHLARCGWTTTIDRAFADVVDGCAHRPGEDGTWITPEMRRAYGRLARLGWAHSLEVWEGGELVGGIYGVQVGAVFTGESMFHRRADASKVALVDLASRFGEAGGRLIDVQITTPHLSSMGARDLPRARFLQALSAASRSDVRMRADELHVARIPLGG